MDIKGRIKMAMAKASMPKKDKKEKLVLKTKKAEAITTTPIKAEQQGMSRAQQARMVDFTPSSRKNLTLNTKLRKATIEMGPGKVYGMMKKNS